MQFKSRNRRHSCPKQKINTLSHATTRRRHVKSLLSPPSFHTKTIREFIPERIVSSFRGEVKPIPSRETRSFFENPFFKETGEILGRRQPTKEAPIGMSSRSSISDVATLRENCFRISILLLKFTSQIQSCFRRQCLKTGFKE